MRCSVKKPWGKKSVRLAIGIGKDANLDCLQKFIGHNELKPFHASNPEELAKYIKFVSTEIVKSVSAPPSSVNGEIATGNAYLPMPVAAKCDDLPDEVW